MFNKLKEKLKISKKMVPALVILSLIVAVSILGMTYAYFSIQVNGNEEASSIIATTASLRLNYIDGPEIVLENVFPGDFVEKEVKVENVGTVGVSYAIGFVNMVNEVLNDELVVSYTCESYINYGTLSQKESGNCYPLEETPIDQVNPGIEEGIYIGVGITQVYNIKIEFKEMNTSQNYNQGASFSGVLNIGETLDSFVLVAQVLYEDDTPCVGCTAEVHSRVRTAITDENGIFRMPKVLQGTHEIIIADAEDNLVMNGNIRIETAPVANVEGTTIRGVKGNEYVGITLKAKEETKTIKAISLLDYATLEVDLSGGQTTQQFASMYFLGDEITLQQPTRQGFTFNGWELESQSGTSTIVNDKLTLGIMNTKITAKWYIPVGTAYDYDFALPSGGEQSFEALVSGWYEIEAWGAQGGDSSNSMMGGKGGYTSGKIYLDLDEMLVVYVGGTTTDSSRGYNGGGLGYGSSKGGGGATDIRYGTNDANNRIMVAAGGGGSGYLSSSDNSSGGEGGGLTGQPGRSKITNYNYNGTGATQTASGYSGYSSSSGVGSFGIGGSGAIYNTDGLIYGGGGGGGGYYGGGGGYAYQSRIGSTSGGGGSSFISGYAGVTAIDEGSIGEPRAHTNNNTKHYSGKYFVDGVMITGNESMPSPSGGTEIGHSGNGYVRITYLGTNAPIRINTKLNNVQYIKDCGIRNAHNSAMYWDEIQAVKDGVNLAYGKAVTSTISISGLTRVTDGILGIQTHVGVTTSKTECVTVNLGNTYDLDEIMVLHLPAEIYLAYQPFQDNITYVSSDNVNWIDVINVGDVIEYSTGKRVNAYSNDVTY